MRTGTLSRAPASRSRRRDGYTGSEGTARDRLLAALEEATRPPNPLDTLEAFQRYHHRDLGTLDEIGLLVEEHGGLHALAIVRDGAARSWFTARILRVRAERRSRAGATWR